MEKYLTFCQHCHMKCRLHVTLKNGRIISIKNGMGIKGVKGIYAHEVISHPQRLTHPMKRTGPRGEGLWRRITWEEALDAMAEHYGGIRDRHGPLALASVLGCAHKEPTYYATFLFSHVLGTPNIIDINRQCNVPQLLAASTTFGDSTVNMEIGPDFLRSRCVLIWGGNPKHNYPPLYNHIRIARSKGAKIIVVDPRPHEEMGSDDLWLRVRPGTDAFLALSMIHVIIDEGLYDQDLVRKACVGFEALASHVETYTPKKAQEVTWVAKEKIVEAARWFSTIHPSCLYARLGAVAQHVNATQTARALCILTALGADLDVPGGNLLSDDLGGYRHQRSFSQFPQFPPGVEEERYGANSYPLICAPSHRVHPYASFRRSHGPDCTNAMLDGRLRGLYIPGCNFVVSEGDSGKAWQALNNLDFLVVADLFMTPTAELADLVLPAAHFLETEVPMRAYQDMGPKGRNYILASRKILEPRGECWDDRKIVIELAKRLGVKLPWRSVEEFNDWTLVPIGVTFREIRDSKSQQLSFPVRYRKFEETGFSTPSGKVELYSETFEKFGYAPLPSYQEPFQSFRGEENEDRYPLILITHRDVHYMHSEFRQIPSIRARYPEPLIEIHPKTAESLDIEEGGKLCVEMPGFLRRVIGRARFVPELHPRVVSCVSHWWFPEKPGPEYGCFESNINSIIASGPPYDPITGAHQGRGLRCRIRKA